MDIKQINVNDDDDEIKELTADNLALSQLSNSQDEALAKLEAKIEELEHNEVHYLQMLEDEGIDSSAAKSSECIYQTKVDELTAAVSVLQQVLLEVSHAQQCGSEWYSKGERGLYQQVSMWVRRGQEAITALKQEVSDE